MTPSYRGARAVTTREEHPPRPDRPPQFPSPCKGEGIGTEELEEIFNTLLGKGQVYEPILGRVKVVKKKEKK